MTLEYFERPILLKNGYQTQTLNFRRFHYPNNVLEKGTGMAGSLLNSENCTDSAVAESPNADSTPEEWAWLELSVDIIQPTLFVSAAKRVLGVLVN